MAGDLHSEPNNWSENVSRGLDGRIASLADAQHRVLGREQLLRLGLSKRNIAYRLSISRLHEVLPGVYSVGARTLTAEGRLMAVALWAGPDAFISHRSAAALRGILPARGTIHVTCRRRRSPRPGIAVHQRLLPADEVTTVDGIPVTTTARTLLDVAAREGRHALLRALREAEFLRLADATSLPTLISRYPRGRGTAIARVVLEGRRAAGHTESELEDRFLEFLDHRNIEAPRANAWIELDGNRFRVDFLWERERVIVELDGRQAHDGDDPFESDRRRDLALMSAGYVVVRITWRRLHDDPDRLARELRALLAARRSTGAAPAAR